MVYVGDTLFAELKLNSGKPILQGQRCSGPHAANEMRKRHEQPVPPNAARRTDLVLIQSQLLLRLPKEHLNRPSLQIQIQNVLCRKAAICTDKSTKGVRDPKGTFRIGNQNDSVFQITQTALIAVHIVLALVNGDEVDICVRYPDKLSKL